MGDEDHANTMVQLVTTGGPDYISSLGYAFQLPDGSQVVFRADPKAPDEAKASEAEAVMLNRHQSCSAGQTLEAISDSPEGVHEASATATMAAVEAADAAGRRRVAVVLNDEGVATAVPLHSVVEAGLSQRVLFQEDGQPVILEVLDQLDGSPNQEADPDQRDSPVSEDAAAQSWLSGADGAPPDGRHMKTGMWSREEVDLLSANMEQFCRDRGIRNPEDIIFRCSKDERKNFYRTVARGINRPLFSIYRRIIRMYDRKNHVGRYTDDEVEQLRNLRAIHGNKWQTIGAMMGRSAASVKDRVRVLRDNCNHGKWLKEEEERLEQSVYDLTQCLPGQQVTSGINWAAVAQKVMTRSEKQCRSKWLNNLSWKTTGGEEWTRDDDRHLLDVLIQSEITEEGDVDWISLAQTWPRNSVRSPQWLRGRWWTLKQQLKNHQRISFRETLAGLVQMASHGVVELQLDAEAEDQAQAESDADVGWSRCESAETAALSPPCAAPQPLIPPGACVFVDQQGRVVPAGSLAVQEDGTYLLDPLADVTGYRGAAVMIGGQLYSTLPLPPPPPPPPPLTLSQPPSQSPLPSPPSSSPSLPGSLPQQPSPSPSPPPTTHLSLVQSVAGTDQMVLESAAIPLLHHPGGATLQPEEPTRSAPGVYHVPTEPGVVLVSAPTLPQPEYSTEVEARLSEQITAAHHTAVIRGDPIMSRTAPGISSEDECLHCPQ